MIKTTDKTQRSRRVGILCCHFVRNFAYYEAGFEDGKIKSEDQFVVSLNGNFLDISVLEWCKLFGDHNDKHHWKKIMSCDPTFKKRMLDELKISQEDFDLTYKSFREYRDKFIAHLDSDEIMKIPEVSKGLNMVFFYYKEVKAMCEEIADWPNSIEIFYKEHYKNALMQYDKLKT